jgi:hypothetical protein
MTRSVRAMAVVLAGAGVLLLPGSAVAAYTSPTLQVTSAGSRTTIDLTANPSDDPTERIVIYAPAGVAATVTQPPGTILGPVQAQVLALGFGGALLPLVGELRVAAPGEVPASQSAPCLHGHAPAATWLLAVQAAGQTLSVPLYVLPPAGPETAFASVKLLGCFSAPDVQPQTGCAPFCAKILRAQLALNGVFASGGGTWRALWTPYSPGTGLANAAGSVEARAEVATGAVTAQARRTGRNKQGVRVTGTVRQAGVAAVGTPVSVFGGKTRGSLRRLGTVRTADNGTFAYTRTTGGLTFFRATSAALPRKSEAGCAAAGLPGVRCVNATVSGFTAASAIVRAR